MWILIDARFEVECFSTFACVSTLIYGWYRKLSALGLCWNLSNLIEMILYSICLYSILQEVWTVHSFLYSISKFKNLLFYSPFFGLMKTVHPTHKLRNLKQSKERTDTWQGKHLLFKFSDTRIWFEAPLVVVLIKTEYINQSSGKIFRKNKLPYHVFNDPEWYPFFPQPQTLDMLISVYYYLINFPKRGKTLNLNISLH